MKKCKFLFKQAVNIGIFLFLHAHAQVPKDTLLSIGSFPFGVSYSVVYDSVRQLIYLSSGGGVFILGTDGQQVWLISDKIRSRSLGHIEELAYEPQRKLLALGTLKGLELWDVQDPTNPQRLWATQPNEIYGANDVVIHENLLFAQGFEGPLLIYDISNPASPQLLKELYPPYDGSDDILLYGNYLFLANTSDIHVIDVSDPANAYIVTSWNDPNAVNPIIIGLARRGNYLYALNGNEGLYILDISNPTQPQVVRHLTRYLEIDLVPDGEMRLYDTLLVAPAVKSINTGGGLSETVEGVAVYSIARPDTLKPLAFWRPVSDPAVMSIPRSVDIFDSLIFVTGFKGKQDNRYELEWGFFMLRFNGTLSALDSFATFGSETREIILHDTLLLYANGTGGGVVILNVNDPANPQLVSRVRFPFHKVSDIAFNGDTLVIAALEDMGFAIISVASWDNPKVLRIKQPVNVVPNSITHLFLRDSVVYGLDGFVGVMYVYNWVDNLEAPAVTFPSMLYVVDVDTVGDYLIVFSDRGYVRIDISNPMQPVGIDNQWQDPSNGEIWTYNVVGRFGRTFYMVGRPLTNNNQTLYILDFSDPTNPQTIAVLDSMPNGDAIYIHNCMRFVAPDTFYACAFNISISKVAFTSSWNLMPLASAYIGSRGKYTIAVRQPYLFAGSDRSGIEIFKDTTVLVSATEEPETFSDNKPIEFAMGPDTWLMKVSQAGTYRIQVFDLTGQQVFSTTVSLPAGTYRFVAARYFSRGTYLLLAEHENQVAWKGILTK